MAKIATPSVERVAYGLGWLAAGQAAQRLGGFPSDEAAGEVDRIIRAVARVAAVMAGDPVEPLTDDQLKRLAELAGAAAVAEVVGGEG